MEKQDGVINIAEAYEILAPLVDQEVLDFIRKRNDLKALRRLVRAYLDDVYLSEE